jgi:methyl-accepting chemotaxis protein
VGAIRHIRETIGEIKDITTDITMGVDEQRNATQEIANNVLQAAGSTKKVTENIEGVSTAAVDTHKASGEVLNAARDLAQQSGLLRAEVDRFLAAARVST